MGLPYFPMYPTDFEADTSHLTLAEDGAYNRLLRLMWMTAGCSLPDDDVWVMRRMRVDKATFDSVVSVVIHEFFQRKGGRIVSHRLAKEYQKTDLAHKKRVAAGSMGGKAKALKSGNNSSSNAKAMPYQPEPEPEPIVKDTNVSQKCGLFGEDEKPKKPSKVYLPQGWVPDDVATEYALSQQLTNDEIRELADEFQTYWSERTDAKAKKSERGWVQCWQGHVRRNASTYIRNRRMAGGSINGGGGQAGGLAGAYARRHLGG